MNILRDLLKASVYLLLLISLTMGFMYGLKWSYDEFPTVHSMIDAVGSMLLTKSS